MKTLWLDTETYSSVDIRTQGLYRYAESADFEVLLFSYAIDQHPPELWDVTQGAQMPENLRLALADESVELVAHNAPFDRKALKEGLGIETPVSRWRCTMVKALAHGFPASLDETGQILGLPNDTQKLKIGKKLINLFCKPAPSNHKADRYNAHNKPEEWALFCEYAIQDIRAMRALDTRLPNWNTGKQEHALWCLDQKINERGFEVDVPLVEAGIAATNRQKEANRVRFRELVNGEVSSPSQRAKFLEYLNDKYNLGIDNTRKDTLEALLAKDLPNDLQELLTLSIASNKTSTSKYGAMHGAVSYDGRFRGGLQFNGAARTRRYAGRVFQPQNLPSRLPKGVMGKVRGFVEALKNGTDDVYTEDRMSLSAAALRAVLKAPKGKILRIADLSNIEGRITAWVAGEDWKIQAFRNYDAGTGHDLYKVSASEMTGIPPEKISKTLRNGLGKPAELGLGYQGGVYALRKMLGNKAMYDYWDEITTAVPHKFIVKAHDNFERWGSGDLRDIDKAEWIACETVKLAWRAKNPRIVALWYDIERAAKQALAAPKQWFKAGRLAYGTTSHSGFRYLLCRLPSGRYLIYFDPKIQDGKITYMGLEMFNNRRMWMRRGFYGGLGLENAAQAIAGDILKHGLPLVEAAGMSAVLSVHDEVIAEDDELLDGESRIQELSDILATNPEWADGLPLAAEGFSDYQYGKGDAMVTVHHNGYVFGECSSSTLGAMKLMADTDPREAQSQLSEYRTNWQRALDETDNRDKADTLTIVGAWIKATEKHIHIRLNENPRIGNTVTEVHHNGYVFGECSSSTLGAMKLMANNDPQEAQSQLSDYQTNWQLALDETDNRDKADTLNVVGAWIKATENHINERIKVRKAGL